MSTLTLVACLIVLYGTDNVTLNAFQCFLSSIEIHPSFLLCYLSSTLLPLPIMFCRNLKFTDLTSSSHIVGTK